MLAQTCQQPAIMREVDRVIRSDQSAGIEILPHVPPAGDKAENRHAPREPGIAAPLPPRAEGKQDDAGERQRQERRLGEKSKSEDEAGREMDGETAVRPERAPQQHCDHAGR